MGFQHDPLGTRSSFILKNKLFFEKQDFIGGLYNFYIIAYNIWHAGGGIHMTRRRVSGVVSSCYDSHCVAKGAHPTPPHPIPTPPHPQKIKL